MLAGSILIVLPEILMQAPNSSRVLKSAGSFAIGEGILLLLGGLLLIIADKEHTVTFLSEFTGALLVIAGVVGVVRAIQIGHGSNAWVGPVIAALAGLILLIDGQVAAAAVVQVLGVFLLVIGVMQIAGSIAARNSQHDRWALLLASGIISCILGAIIFIAPTLAMYIFTIFVGIWLTVLGIIMIRTGLEIRRAVA